MKLKFVVLVLFAGLIMISCRKEEKAPINPNTGGGGGGNSPISSNGTMFYGIFTTNEVTNVLTATSTPITFTTISAYFSSQSVPGYAPSTAVKVNKVYFNADSLPYNNTSNYYTANNANLATETWSVDGANGIATFSLTNNFVTPTFSISGAMPDTVYKSVGFTVSINNVSNATTGYFSITDGTNSQQGFYSVNLASGTNNITITPNNMSTLFTGVIAHLSITVSNNKVFAISGKDYQFCRQNQWIKTIKIKP